jgi:Ca-activated chloride channel homolog
MMEFTRPLLLILLLPWLTLVVIFFRRNLKSLGSLKSGVSVRFIRKFSLYSERRLIVHSAAIFLMGGMLILSAARPVISGSDERTIRQERIIFMIDASLSMVSGDVSRSAKKKKIKNRIGQALEVTRRIMDELTGYRFGLISFSGISSFHSPPVADKKIIETYLDNFRLHIFQKMGTNFKTALLSLIHLTEYSGDTGFQGVIISDGEAREYDDYSEELITLEKKGIPVHTIAVGTEKGGGIVIYDPRDVLEGKRKPKTIKSAITCMVEKHLKEIAEATGGEFIVMEKDLSLKKIVRAIKNAPGGRREMGTKGKTPMSHWFIIIFALFFFADLLIFDNLDFFREIVKKAAERAAGRMKR